MALSRPYLGVHYPSDVIGGIIAGVAWLGFVVAGMHAAQYFAARKPSATAGAGEWPWSFFCLLEDRTHRGIIHRGPGEDAPSLNRCLVP